jgi:omega-hydroxy-beta-dihydromenaquinone-9 sulfotransferase
MLKWYYRILVSAWKTFGFGSVFLHSLLVLPPFFYFTRLTLFLDRIFFPQYRNLTIKSPVFLLGGRSGTTFLQRLLTDTGDFAAFEAWQILFPALTARTLVKPIVHYLIKSNRSTLTSAKSGHEVHLNSVEEDELLFVHNIDTQFVRLLTPLVFNDQEYAELSFYDRQSESRRQSSMRFFQGCLQRQILSTGKEQVISKLTYSIHRIKTLIEAFPDAKFIFLMRSPHDVIPSYLSLHRQLFEHWWGLENIPPDTLKQSFERIYGYAIELYRYFYDIHKNREIPEDRVMILHYELLYSELDKSFEKIVAFTGIKSSERLRQSVEHQAQIQKNYKRQHKVIDLEEYGLTSDKIVEDFWFVFEEYGFDKNPESKLGK